MIISSPALDQVVGAPASHSAPPALPSLAPAVAHALMSLAAAASSSSSASSPSNSSAPSSDNNYDDADALAAEFHGDLEWGASPANPVIGTDIKCDSEIYLELVCFSMKEIFSVCRGILSTVDGNKVVQFANHDAAPWKDMKPSTKPTNEILRKEVIRRWRLYLEADGTPKPRSKAWTAMQCFTWLDAHPITTPADVAYLRQLYLGHVDELRIADEEAEIEREMLAGHASMNNKAWTGIEPYLHLIECLVSNDAIRSAFLRRNSLPSNRMELENRNAPDRPLTCYEMLAVLWNDSTFNPETSTNDMHEAFARPILLSYSQVAHMIPATAEICKEKLTSMLVSMARIISKWERSGQGDGGFGLPFAFPRCFGFAPILSWWEATIPHVPVA